MITVLHRGGSSQMITVLHRGGPANGYGISLLYHYHPHMTDHHRSSITTTTKLFSKKTLQTNSSTSITATAGIFNFQKLFPEKRMSNSSKVFFVLAISSLNRSHCDENTWYTVLVPKMANFGPNLALRSILAHTCKKRVMLRRRLFWPKKNCRKSA